MEKVTENNQKNDKHLELKNCLENLKKEIVLFLGTKKDYLNDLKKFNASNRLNFVLISLEEINKNLKKVFKKNTINLSISGIIINIDNPINKVVYKPFVLLKTNLLSIEFSKGYFFNKFSLFSDKEDYLLLEPIYELRKELSKKDIDKMIDIINTVIAEISQYNYKEEPMLIKTKKINKKRQQYLKLIEEESI